VGRDSYHGLPWFHVSQDDRAGANLRSLSNAETAKVTAYDNRSHANEHIVLNNNPMRRSNPGFTSQSDMMIDCDVLPNLHLRVNDDAQRPVPQIDLTLKFSFVRKQTLKAEVVQQLQELGKENESPLVGLTTPIPDTSGSQHIRTILSVSLSCQLLWDYKPNTSSTVSFRSTPDDKGNKRILPILESRSFHHAY
jgi:hypothetical protein